MYPGASKWLAIESRINALSEEKKTRFMSLYSYCNCRETPRKEIPVMKIFDINSFEIQPHETDHGIRYTYIYEIASRIIHVFQTRSAATRRTYT